MAQYLIKDNSLTEIGDAIREKLGLTNKMTPAAMASYIRDHLGTGLSSILQKDISYIYDTTLTSIKPYAFYDCNELHTAIFTEVESIGENAFASCEKLSRFESPKCSTVDTNAFSGCTSLTSVNLGVTDLTSTDGIGIVLINNSNLTSAYFSQTSQIGQYTFQSCINLTDTSFPSATFVSQYAFDKCYSLKSITLPEVTSAGHYIFSNCSSLERIEMPKCNYFGKYAFQNCTSLKELIVPAWNSSHASGVFDGVSECPIEVLHFGFPTAPATFSGKSTLKTISISTTTSTASSAFRDCSNLTSIYAPLLARIENRTFTNDYALSTFSFPAATYIGPFAFYECSSILELSSTNLPNENLIIGEQAFGICSNLTYVDLPCISMSSYAFSSCTSLERVKMLNLQSTSSAPFYGCIRLSYLELGLPLINSSYVFKNTISAVKYLSLPYLISTTSNNIFYGASSLQSIYAPMLQNLSGAGVFQMCSLLSDIYMPEVQYISQAAFGSCYSLSKVSFPKCSHIGIRCFEYDSALTHVDLPALESYTFANNSASEAFYGCNNLQYVHMGKVATMSNILSNHTALTTVSLPGTTVLSTYCFYNCTSLSDIYIPNCVTIGQQAFMQCTSLSTFDFPLVTSVAARAFEACDALEEVYLPLLTSLQNYVFRSCTNLKVIDVPACTQYYSANSYWPWTAVTTLESVNIGSMTLATGTGLSNQVNLKTVRMPMTAQVTARAFEGCTALENVTITACTSMHNRAFQNCTSLSQFTLPVGIATISTSTFSGCNALMSLYLPCSSVVTLANVNAFTNTPMSLSTFTSAFGSIYVPASLYESYIAATNWTAYSDRIVSVATSSSVNVGRYLFSYQYISSGSYYSIYSWHTNLAIPFGYTWRDVMNNNIRFSYRLSGSNALQYTYLSLSTDNYTPMIRGKIISGQHIDDYIIPGKRYN